jgi:putative ABC transport system permease protein
MIQKIESNSMSITECIRIAMRSVSANKLRSALTMLGMIIGVAAVIALMSIGQGAQASITSRIESMGTNLLFIRPGGTQSGGVRTAQGSAQTLTTDDADALTSVQGVVAVAPEADGFGQIAYMGNNVNVRVLGITPEYQTIRNYQMASGNFIESGQVTSRSAVAVLGANTATDLFGDSDAVGQSIRINGVSLRVIGVLEAKGGSGMGSQDDVVLTPITTAQSRLLGSSRFRGGNSVSVINVQVADKSQINAVTQSIGDVLRDRHNIMYDDDFQIQSQQDILETATEVTGILTLFLTGIAAISLLVGGIGIMNIMLVSVTERTREIGIRKAIGAKRRDVLAQFLAEAMVLSVSGGVIGILLGIVLGRLVGQIQMGGTAIVPVVSLDSILLATLFSVAIGLFFGIYPANQAAKLNPIEALRYE